MQDLAYRRARAGTRASGRDRDGHCLAEAEHSRRPERKGTHLLASKLDSESFREYAELEANGA